MQADVYNRPVETLKLYDELYAVYCLAYEALEEKGVFQALARLQAGT